jgi:hypothetical protein
MDKRLKGFTKPTVCGMKKRRTNNSFIGHVDEKSETPPSFFRTILGEEASPPTLFILNEGDTLQSVFSRIPE